MASKNDFTDYIAIISLFLLGFYLMKLYCSRSDRMQYGASSLIKLTEPVDPANLDTKNRFSNYASPIISDPSADNNDTDPDNNDFFDLKQPKYKYIKKNNYRRYLDANKRKFEGFKEKNNSVLKKLGRTEIIGEEYLIDEYDDPVDKANKFIYDTRNGSAGNFFKEIENLKISDVYDYMTKNKSIVQKKLKPPILDGQTMDPIYLRTDKKHVTFKPDNWMYENEHENFGGQIGPGLQASDPMDSTWVAV